MTQHTSKRMGIERYLSTKYMSAWLILLIDTTISMMMSLASFSIISKLSTHPFFSARFAVVLAVISALCSVCAFMVFKTFLDVIRHSTLRVIGKIGGFAVLKECLVMLCLLVVLLKFTNLFPYPEALPKPFSPAMKMGYMLDFLTTLISLLALRLMMIVGYDLLKMRSSQRESRKRVLVYGTDDKAIALTIRLHNSPHYEPIGFLTYGRRFKRYMIADLPVYYFETRENMPYLVDRLDIDAVIFTTPGAAQEERERLVQFCTEADIKVMIAPPIGEVSGGKMMKQSIREIRIEDLLGRPEIKISLEEIHENFRGKTVMVTGAAGSIGS